MNLTLLIAGLLALVATFGHTFGGLKKVIPHMSGATFDLQAKVTIKAVWYVMSVNFLLFSVCLVITGINPDIIEQTKWLVRIISVHYLLYSIIFLIIGLNSGLEKGVFKLFQWIVFLCIAILSWFSV